MNKIDYKKRRLQQLGLQWLVFTVSIFFLFFISYQYFSDQIVYETDWYYFFLRWVNRNRGIVLYSTLITGYFFLCLHSYWKTLKLTEDVYVQLDKITEDDEQYITFYQNEPMITQKINEIKMEVRQKTKTMQEDEKRKNDLIMYLAHDIKTPLTSVIGYLSILKEEKDLTERFQEKYLQVVYEKSLRLEELTNEFFDITRFNLNNLVLQKKETHYSFMIEQIVSEFHPLFMQKKLEVKLDVLPDIQLVIDAGKIERVLDNVIRNAIVYATPSTTIRVIAQRQQDVIFTSIENVGVPIPKQKIDKIFDEFFRMDASRSTETQGAGLGLAIAKNIISTHKGTIEAVSVDDQFCIKFSLPTQS